MGNDIRIRRAVADDLPGIVAMGRTFYAQTAYASFSEYSDASALVLCQMMLDSGVLLVAESDGALVGMVGLAITPFLFNHAQKTAHEVMWWVHPSARGGGAGKALLDAVEPACREKGVVAIQMLHLSNSPASAAAMYQRMGYEQSECSYVKVI